MVPDANSNIPGANPDVFHCPAPNAVSYADPDCDTIRILVGVATLRDLLKPLEDLDPIYPLGDPLPPGPSGLEDDGDDVT